MYLGIDIGGTKTLLAVFNGKGKVIEEIKFPTPHNYKDFLTELTKSVNELSTKDFKAFAVAVPGKVDRKHGIGIAFGNLPWKKVPIEVDIEKIVKAPGLIENDANLAGLSEALLVKKEYKKVLYLTISTGIGGVYVIDGVIDKNTEDSEMGHITLEHAGEFMIWEDFASGRAIVERFGKRASDITDPETWDIIARNIAVGLIGIIATLTPDVIILGGGVGTHLSKFKTRLDKQMRTYENPMVTIPPILQAKRPEEAVVYGCYDLIHMKYGKTSK